MTIIRDGKEYTLTSDELYTAYLEQQREFDRMDVEDILEGRSDGSEEDNALQMYLCSHVDEIAYEMRRNIDKYDMHWDTARDEATRTAIEKYKAGIK